MGSQYRRSGSRHSITCLQQRPVERFAVEGYQHRTFRQPFRECRQQRALFTVFPHEQLLDFEAAAFPPRQADQKRIGAGSAG